jgi:two-component system, OmpR family, sensor kinase
MVVVLAAAGAFVYVQLRAELDASVDAALRARAAAIEQAGAAAGAAGEAEEGFGQMLDPSGRVLGAAGGTREPVLGPAELRLAAREPIVIERTVDGIEGTARVLARAGRDSSVVVVGQSLEDRDDTLAALVAAFALGGPLAVVAASLLGYALAAAGLAPVEAMRRRAAGVSLAAGEQRLPLPPARDEVRRLGETLNDMLDRLRQSFERERRFVADASHELRTPVAVIKTELEGALRAGGHRPEVHAALVAAVEECDHLAQLAGDPLVIARAADGRLPVRAERLDAAAVLEDVRLRFADRAGRQDRRVRVEAPTGLTVQADPLRVRQALGNLLDNALRHGQGTVVLSARAVDGGTELAVGDEGPGFPPAIADHAFERFTRGDEARSGPGSGLGLAIVRAIAEAHGGHAAADGAAVTITLPSQAGLSGGP